MFVRARQSLGYKQQLSRCYQTNKRIISVRDEKSKPESKNLVRNVYGIQMLSESLHKQIFGKRETKPESAQAASCRNELQRFGLCCDDAEILPEVDFQLPKMCGKNIDDHFKSIAKDQSQPYIDLLNSLGKADLVPMPKKWAFQVRSIFINVNLSN
jgi:DNA polymerase gamma 1